MKKVISLILLTVWALGKIFAQGAVSGNGLFVASVMKEAGQKMIYIHKFKTRELIRKLVFKPAITTSDIQWVKYNYEGSFVAAHSGAYIYVFNVMENKQVAFLNGKDIIFPVKTDDYFFIVGSNSIVRYSSEGKKQFVYSLPSGKTVKRVVLSPKEDLLAVETEQNRIYMFKIDQSRYAKEYAGDQVEFNRTGNLFVVKYTYGQKVRVSTYKASNFYQDRVLTSDVLSTRTKNKFFPNRSSLGKDGMFVAFYTAKGNNVEIFVFNTYSRKLVWVINNFKNTANELYPITWTAPNIMIARGANMMAGEYNIISHTTASLFLRIDPINANSELSVENQRKKLILSPDYHYALLPTSQGLYIRDTRIPSVNFKFENTRFLSFSASGKYLFVDKDGVVNALITAQVSQALSRHLTAKFYPFDKILKSTVPEKYQPDVKPPKGYAYFYVNNTKQIVKLDTAKLHLVLRSVHIDENNVEIQVNLVDRHGNIFLGGADPSWKYIWCNLILQNPSLNVKQVKNFIVEEHNISIPTAYALVLDHSGSMGDKRANILQYGALQLINKKIGTNAFMLIKYDHRVKVEVPLTTEKYLLERKLNNTGLAGYGGATALIDAAYIAVKKLAATKKYKRKVVLLFTDGYENASFYTKSTLLREAIKNHIEIDVIGFGKEINEQYLKDIAYNTGGIYMHIYKSQDIKKIFPDVDYKSRHYYSIKFHTPVKGKYVAMIQICQDFDKHDSLLVAIDTKANDEPLDSRSPVITLKRPKITLAKFQPLMIPRKPKLKPVKSRKILKDFHNIHFPNILFETNSDKILKSDEKGIDQIVAFMRKYPYVYLEIDGHTDNTGTHEFNMDLSKRRAEAAKRLIVAKGIPAARIITKGFGETKPIASNDTEEGRRLNRRIEFKVLVH